MDFEEKLLKISKHRLGTQIGTLVKDTTPVQGYLTEIKGP